MTDRKMTDGEEAALQRGYVYGIVVVTTLYLILKVISWLI
jgi:hypothetical protein